MADWGPGFKRGTDRPECSKHGARYLGGQVSDEDVGVTVCLACAETSGTLTKSGARLLAQKRGSGA
jgi:hypothetical protein